MADVVATHDVRKPNTDTLYSVRRSIIGELKTWVDTPFDYGCCEKGKGTDCVKWIVQVYKNHGMVSDHYTPPHLPPDWHYFPNKFDRNIFQRELKKWCLPIKISELENADIISFCYGPYDTECHIGVILDENTFIHAAQYRQVKMQKLRGAMSHACNAYRVGRLA